VTDVIRAAVQATSTRPGLLANVPAEFRSDRHLVAYGRERLADEDLVGERAVDLRGVEVCDAALERGADEANPSCRSLAGP
jgi:hypothetical protein